MAEEDLRTVARRHQAPHRVADAPGAGQPHRPRVPAGRAALPPAARGPAAPRRAPGRRARVLGRDHELHDRRRSSRWRWRPPGLYTFRRLLAVDLAPGGPPARAVARGRLGYRGDRGEHVLDPRAAGGARRTRRTVPLLPVLRVRHGRQRPRHVHERGDSDWPAGIAHHPRRDPRGSAGGVPRPVPGRRPCRDSTRAFTRACASWGSSSPIVRAATSSASFPTASRPGLRSGTGSTGSPAPGGRSAHGRSLGCSPSISPGPAWPGERRPSSPPCCSRSTWSRSGTRGIPNSEVMQQALLFAALLALARAYRDDDRFFAPSRRRAARHADVRAAGFAGHPGRRQRGTPAGRRSTGSDWAWTFLAPLAALLAAAAAYFAGPLRAYSAIPVGQMRGAGDWQPRSERWSSRARRFAVHAPRGRR